ncbi:MAG: hypothetical protein JSR82_01505 [Verrucomicrobia bacterium]|nr:hypothetical protein [Verrucomicrobiota bacterium]
MALPKRTQKQVAERLKGNLDYFESPAGIRTLRGWLYFFGIVLAIALPFGWHMFMASEEVFNPGPISRAHAPIAHDCGTCHPQLAQIRKQSNQVREIYNEPYWQRIDQACQTCHQGFALHFPNTIPDDTTGHKGAFETNSCTSCHREHLTAEKMVASTDSNCAACHNRTDLMAASAEKGRKIPASRFPTRPNDGLKYFKKDRPLNGYTQVFPKFDQGHPIFQIHEQNLKDPNPIRFNHWRHSQADIPVTSKGERANDCNFCHKPDGRGNFQRISFEKHCADCHAIKFDPNTPGLEIPHGRPEQVREFLRALDVKYIEYFRKLEGNNEQRVRERAGTAIQGLIQTYGQQSSADGSLTKLERQVFFNGIAPSGGNNPFNRNLNITERAQFTGCAYCHTMTEQRNSTPMVAATNMADRFLSNGEFNHAKHGMQSCSQCHNTIANSRETSDINIPTQQSCTECHNSGPRGVKNDCQSCHHYHAPGYKTVNAPKIAEAEGQTLPTTREMMLAR